MHHFHFVDDDLYAEDLPVAEVAAAVGTPCFLYSARTVDDQFDRIQQAFAPVEHLICYALKANANPGVLSLLANKGAGADVVSGGELYLARKHGFPADKIVLAGVGKRDDEIRYALEQDILALHVESYQELQVVNALAAEAGKPAPVALRINPNVDIKGHPYVSTGRQADKFGIGESDVRRILTEFEDFGNVKIIGLHCHIGSQIKDVAPYRQALAVLRTWAEELRRLNHPLAYVDIGGGLGVQYENVFASDAEGMLRPETLAEGLLPDIRALGCKVLLEPGRALVAHAGILVTRVLYTKETQGKRFVIVDAGMNDLLRPSLYDAYHEIVPVERRTSKTVRVDVVGPICESGDFFGRDRDLPSVQRGDLLAVMTAGAYGYVLSSNYNARLRPPEVLVHGDRFTVTRPRQVLEDLWR